MNTKTTLFLAFVLILLGLLYYVVQSRPAPVTGETPSPVASATMGTARKLLDKELGEIVKVVVKKRGENADWVFEKEGPNEGAGVAGWKMTAPVQMTCVRWEVDRFGTEIGNLRYDVSYRPGEPGAVTAEQAGLASPESIITLIDKEGRNAAVEIGKLVSKGETYVRLVGDTAVVVAKADLKNLLKERPLDFRDKQLWTFKPEDVKRIEIEERSQRDAVSFAFVREGAHWMMAMPVTARATGKVDEMLNTVSRLRVVDWVNDRADRLSGFGLDPAERVVRLTVEEKVPKPALEGADSPETAGQQDTSTPETELRSVVHTLRLSEQSPIGEETKVYVRINDESAVGTLMKTLADKCRPTLDEWRDMQLVQADVNAVARIEIRESDGNANLKKDGEEWLFEDGARAESSAVNELVAAVRDLKAVTILQGEELANQGAFGFAQPQAEVRLTIPGHEAAERIVIGAFTDPTSRRLVYVGRGDLLAVAKVRAEDIGAMTRSVLTYRDRTVVDISPIRMQRIAIARTGAAEHESTTFTLARDGDLWRMVEPVDAEVNGPSVENLLNSLSAFKATRVVSEGGQASAFGLHEPDVTLTLQYQAVGEVAAQTDAGTNENGESSPDDPEGSGALRELTLQAAMHDGQFYVMRGDRPTIHEASPTLHQQLRAEYRTDRVLTFEKEDVSRFTIRHGEVTHAFVKHDNAWLYENEPDLPLDLAKVDNLLLQIRDLRTSRYVVQATDVLTPFGLDEPDLEVQISAKDGLELRLLVSSKTGIVHGDRGVFAHVKGNPGVFLLPADAIPRISVNLADLESKP